ncbi:DUF6587 family protein [Pseudoxanthomonas winnipegensis]|uniref:Uncharacterized protein n=1 Tax=Pseudoxanthomonas winnipegensis TaxID=2480810 RepID=A0A4Q8M9P4_9GAMM|nr:DUF6587 family protein [Pseudoxanthomonas winnipegensis]RZZ90409.1 hypothetical protein EA663_01190 [Pseudoxanthomonas winnipegensis]TAA37434.1 hypothetical protein EA656_01845 [Pseudoxanthomonas winnipegensis]TAA46159.1 hypothetical protein EA655_00230 [Pseudoxanthomonas winnipegensis]
MAPALALQYLVIALAVLVSAWVVAHKQFPNATRRARTALALPLLRAGRPPWMQRLGRALAPPARAVDAACGGCSSCGPQKPAARK